MKIYSSQNLPPHIAKHSPTGMNWGYGGSGPADLALSLLTDCVGRKLADNYYMEFKWEVVAGLKDDWKLTAKSIREWIDSRIKEKTSKI